MWGKETVEKLYKNYRREGAGIVLYAVVMESSYCTLIKQMKIRLFKSVNFAEINKSFI